MDKDSLISILKSYFLHKADTFNIDMVFLYGSWASGSIRKESDIDIAVIFEKEINEEEGFEIATNISLELTDILKREVNALCIDKELSKPMLHYNAIIQGVPLFFKDFTRYVDIRLKAISQMEDFSIFGAKWQSELVKRRIERLKHA
jgi:hypothetical protein